MEVKKKIYPGDRLSYPHRQSICFNHFYNLKMNLLHIILVLYKDVSVVLWEAIIQFIELKALALISLYWLDVNVTFINRWLPNLVLSRWAHNSHRNLVTMLGLSMADFQISPSLVTHKTQRTRTIDPGLGISTSVTFSLHRRGFSLSFCIYFHGNSYDELFKLALRLWKFKRSTRLATGSHRLSFELTG